MQIKKVAKREVSDAFEEAKLSDFANSEYFSVGEDGEVIGLIDERLMLARLAGFGPRGPIFIGLKRTTSGVVVQNVPLSDSSIESFLARRFGGLPLIKEAAYSFHNVVGGNIASVTLALHSHDGGALREVVGATIKPVHSLIENSSDASREIHEFNEQCLQQFLDIRRTIAPDAIELRFNAQRLPALLGLTSDRKTTFAASAAFGSNGGIPPAVYVRSGIENIRHAPTDFTRGEFSERRPTLDLMTPKPRFGYDASLPNNKTRPHKSQLEEYYFRWPGIFMMIEDMESHLCTGEEIFRERFPTPQGFDSKIFARVLRELIVNAFCHGLWCVQETGRDESETTLGNRISIMHAGDRLEVSNFAEDNKISTAAGGHAVTIQRSPLHNALIDINLAHGRKIGLKLVRNRIARMGLPSPMFIRGRNYFRAILPLQNSSPGWCFSSENTEEKKKRYLAIYTARVLPMLGAVDEIVIASLFDVRREKAAEVLSYLADQGILQKKPGIYFPASRSLPKYYIDTDVDISEFLEVLEAGVTFQKAAPEISLGGLYQLSVRSSRHLAPNDLWGHINKVYEYELASPSHAARETDEHIRVFTQLLSTHS